MPDGGPVVVGLLGQTVGGASHMATMEALHGIRLGVMSLTILTPDRRQIF